MNNFTTRKINWIKVTKRIKPEDKDPLKDIDLNKIIDEESKNNFTPSDDDVIQEIKWYDNLFMIAYFYKEYIAMLFAVILLIALLINWFINNTTPQEREAQLRAEIQAIKDTYIANASKEVATLSVQKDTLVNQLTHVNNWITLYEKCIEANQSQDLPVDCTEITITLKDSLKWKVNSNWQAQEIKELKSQWLYARMDELLSYYPVVSWHLDTFIKYWEQYKINPAVVIAIAKADSSLGNQLSTANNIGNVGNNDRWDRVAFETLEKWIEAIYKTLNNRYLWEIYNIWYLSEGWRQALWWPSCKEKNEFCYATSQENWNNNVINTLRLLYNSAEIDESFIFRTNK